MQKAEIIMALKRASIIKKTESGRSMVEMLGVLAVTGVLAVGGLMGFQNAMAKTKANLLISDVKLHALQCAQELYNRERHGEEVAEGTPCGTNVTPLGSYALSGSYENTAEDGVIQISATNIPERVCETVADMGWQLPLSVKIGETVLTADTCGEDNTINFNFAPDLSAIATGGTGGGSTEPADPCANVDCGDHGECQGGKCVCTDNYTGNNCETAPAGCNDNTDCSSNHYCQNGECVCAYPCNYNGEDEVCCNENQYCGNTEGSFDILSCVDYETENCINTCSSSSWATGSVTVSYCPNSGTCYSSSPGDSCSTETLTCGTETTTGKRYCYLNKMKNWWDAKSICSAVGMRLPTVNDLIDNGDVSLNQFAQKINLSTNLPYTWTGDLENACLVHWVDLSMGMVSSNSKTNVDFTSKILCVD